MYKSTLNFLMLTSLLLVSGLSFVEARNTKYDPGDIFQNHYGKTAINVKKATGAETLHKMGFKGQGQSVAIIDMNFLHKDILTIQKKGLLHPLALKEKTVALSDNVPYQRINAHGTDVMNTLHLVAPKAQILPIDVNYRRYLNRGYSHELVEAVRTAIRAKVDAINLSIHVCNVDTSYINVLKEAISKGIAIISSAGNDSTANKPFYLDKLKNIQTGHIVQVNEKIAFDQMGRKGILFAGALNLTNDGQEVYAPFSSHPTTDTESHYLTTIGANVPVPGKFFSGTSASSPLIAGCSLLLQQGTKSLKQPILVETLYKDLHDSGHDIKHNVPETPFNTYKVLNIKNAFQRILSRAKAGAAAVLTPKSAPTKATPVKIPTAVPMKISPIKVSTAAKVAAKNTAAKISAARTAAAKKAAQIKRAANILIFRKLKAAANRPGVRRSAIWQLK